MLGRVGTILQQWFCSTATHTVHEYGARTSSKVCTAQSYSSCSNTPPSQRKFHEFGRSLTFRGVPQLSADHHSIVIVPVVITDCPPDSVSAHLYSPLVRSIASNQSHITIRALAPGGSDKFANLMHCS